MNNKHQALARAQSFDTQTIYPKPQPFRSSVCAADCSSMRLFAQTCTVFVHGHLRNDFREWGIAVFPGWFFKPMRWFILLRVFGVSGR